MRRERRKDPPAAASPMSSPSLGNPRSDSISFGAAWRAEDLGADRDASGQRLSTRTIHFPDRHLHHHHHRYPGTNIGGHGGYRTALRTLRSIALSLIGAITAAKRIQWIHRASSNRSVLALAGASHRYAEIGIGIGIGPIAIAILWRTTIRIVAAAVWQHCRLHHHRSQAIIGVCICSSKPGIVCCTAGRSVPAAIGCPCHTLSTIPHSCANPDLVTADMQGAVWASQ